MQASSEHDAEINKKGQCEPYLLCCGSDVVPEQMYLVIDCEIVCEILPPDDAVFSLLCVFFVFNLHYTSSCTLMFSFLESLLNLKLCKQTRPPSVAHFMAALASHAL